MRDGIWQRGRERNILIAEVVDHRGVSSDIAREFAPEIIKKYKPDTSGVDVMIGYRADDSYGDVIEAFLSGELTVDEVRRLFYKGNLGVQFFLKSELASQQLRFLGAEAVVMSENVMSDISCARKEVLRFLQNRRIEIEGG